MDSMIQTLVTRLQSLKPQWPDIATAADVPLATLEKVARGYTKNPRVGTVERLQRGVEKIQRT